MDLKTAFLQMIYPDSVKCNLCGRELFAETRFSLCSKCQPPPIENRCLKCGREMNNEARYCLDCMNYDRNFDVAFAPYVFDGKAKKLVYKLKYGNAKYLADGMAQMIFDYAPQQFSECDVITFVPLHKARIKERGYNQSQLLAEKLGSLCGKNVEELLIRVVDTKNLARMSAKERREAIKNAFRLKENAFVKGRTILLTDDVFTTGSTSDECAAVLKRAGAERVIVSTFATAKIVPEIY